MTDLERQKLNEEIAPYFGFEFSPRDHEWLKDGWTKPDEDYPRGRYYHELPDFCAIDGPWIGRMVAAVGTAKGVYTDCGQNDTPPRQLHRWMLDGHVYDDSDFGIATGLAFVAMHRAKEAQ